MTVTATALDDVADVLASATGLRLPSGSELLLRSAVAARAAAVAGGDAHAYAQRLRRRAEPDEVAELFDLVAVGQTEFFRHPALYAALTLHLREVAAQAATTGRRINIWSAGCSTGQEVWSLAATCAEVLGSDADFCVWGQDLSRPALAAARQGSYPIAGMARVPQGLERFFARTSVSFRPTSALRAHVRFVRANLVADPPPVGAAVDAVFFCNVGIYFARPVVTRVVANLASALTPQGLLFLGRAESLLGVAHDLDLVDLDPVFAYRRRQPLDAAPVEAGTATARSAAAPGRAGAGARAGEPARAARRRPARERGAPAANDREALASAAGALAAGCLDDAAAIAARLLAADAFVAEAHYVAGAVAERRGDDAAALAAFDRAVYLDPGCALAQVGRAGVLERRGEHRRAGAAYAAAAAVLETASGAERAEPYLEDFPVAALVALARRRAGSG